MAHDLDIRQFFRKAPKNCLKCYFEQHNVLSDFDWTSISPRKLDPLMDAWNSLDADLRGLMVEDFSGIDLLATPVGKVQIIDEAKHHGLDDDVATKLGELDDFFDCAFWAFFEQPECWNGAVFYAAADAKSKRYWRKRINMPRLGRNPTDSDGIALAAALTELFKKHEGRGHHCVVHQYRRKGSSVREYYFAYPQDHRRTAVEYEGDAMTKRPSSPAFEIVFIHDDEEQTLSIWHHGTKDRVKDLQVAFAKAVIGKDIPRDSPKDDRVYDLEAFQDRELAFEPSPELGIAKVEIRKIGIRILGKEPHSIRIELGEDTPTHILYDRLRAVTRSVPQSMRKVARIGLRVTFEIGPTEKSARTRSFELVWPSSCSLRNDSRGQLIQRMLSDHGIEPKRPKQDGSDGGTSE